MRTTTRVRVEIASCLLLLLAPALPARAADDPAERWRPAIERFESQDAEAGIAKGGILFLGSSSIRMWDLAEWFPDLPVLNRGFGGSQISDSLYYFDRLVPPYAPATLVFYAGDNDIAAGKSPAQVIADFESLRGRVRQALPDCRVIFIAIKPSLARFNLVAPMREVNHAIAAMADEDPRLVYVDVDTPMIGADGKPRPELFIGDGLHMTHEGYAIWSQLLRPLLAAD